MTTATTATKTYGLAEHQRDVYEWWMTTHGNSGPEEREWCRNIAYERWVNGKDLLTNEDPPTHWSENA